MPTPRPNQHPNRESWLTDVAARLRPAFAQLGAPLPERLRIAIGFPSTGRRAKATGECWDSTATTSPRKRASRHVRCACPTCGYVVRTGRKWLDQAAPPLAPARTHAAGRRGDRRSGRDERRRATDTASLTPPA